MSTAATRLIGLHLLSLHAQPGMETATPGLYARHAPTGATLGLLRNSEGRASAYAGLTLQRGPLAVTLGAVTGYQRASVLPLVVPSVRFDGGLRLSVIPNPWGPAALHISLERSL